MSQSVVIRGGASLKGEVNIHGAKNASLPILAAVLLTSHEVFLSNVPSLSDIDTMLELLLHHGVKCETEMDYENNGRVLRLLANKVHDFTAPYEIVSKMRASIWVLGALLGRFGQAMVSLPGGCAIGVRQVDLHIDVMRALGANIEIKNGYIYATAPEGGLRATVFEFAKQSVGATINAILAASLANGVSILINCNIEPEIIDLCNFINAMGGKISGVGSSRLEIEGVSELGAVSYRVMPDRIEAGTYMLAAAATRGRVLVKGIDYSMVSYLGKKMLEAGSKITHHDDGFEVSHAGDIKPVNIVTAIYPGFATDLQAQFTAFMALCNGQCSVTENIYDNRFMHVPELCRMGADIVVDGNVASINGVEAMTGAEVMASDLRASVSLIIAALCAQGETKVRRIYHLDRGYQDLEKHLSACGADIRRVED